MLTVLIMLAAATPVSGDAPGRPDRVEGEYLIQVAEGVDLDGIQNRVSEAAPVEVKKVYPRTRTLLVKATDDSFATAAGYSRLARTLTKSSTIVRVEPNYLYYASELPDDPRTNELWFLSRINASEAWDIQNASPQIVVAVIDTGVFQDHEDLDDRLWLNSGEIAGNGLDDDGNGYVDDIHGWDFYNNDGDPAADLVPVDQFPPLCIAHPTKRRYEAHGTHVAGTIGATANNGTGITGISWDIRIMPLKFLGGTCGGGSTSSAIEAIEYAIANGANIINNSWGGGQFSTFLRDALQAASDANILIPCAAGNSGTNNDVDPHYPSNYDVDTIISVAASNQTDDLASFSCFGATSVDLAAPGTAILSTIPQGDEASNGASSDYAAFRGTSMATPIVSGSAALVAARFPQLTASELKSLILGTVDEVQSLSSKVATGGRLNLRAALDPPIPDSIRDAYDSLPVDQRAMFDNPDRRLQLFLNTPFNFRMSSVTSVAMGATSKNYKVLVEFKDQFAADNPLDDQKLQEIQASFANQDEFIKVTSMKGASKSRPVCVLELESLLPEDQLIQALREQEFVEKAEVEQTWRKDL